MVEIDTSAPQQLEFVVKEEEMEAEPTPVEEEPVVPDLIDRPKVSVIQCLPLWLDFLFYSSVTEINHYIHKIFYFLCFCVLGAYLRHEITFFFILS